jgi:hypothetical protein
MAAIFIILSVWKYKLFQRWLCSSKTGVALRSLVLKAAILPPPKAKPPSRLKQDNYYLQDSRVANPGKLSSTWERGAKVGARMQPHAISNNARGFCPFQVGVEARTRRGTRTKGWKLKPPPPPSQSPSRGGRRRRSSKAFLLAELQFLV